MRRTIAAMTAAVALAALAVTGGPSAVAVSEKVATGQRLTATVTVTQTAAAEQNRVVLGSRRRWPGDSDEGFGTYRPELIHNGGAPSGLVKKIEWTNWGQRVAKGWGKTFIYKPTGGYYAKPVRARLRVTRIGHCFAGTPRAYQRMSARVPRRPGGPLGDWFPWSGGDICRP